MNPAGHEAYEDAGRRGVIVGSDVDVIEHLAIQDAAGEVEEDICGAWLLGEGGPA